MFSVFFLFLSLSLVEIYSSVYKKKKSFFSFFLFSGLSGLFPFRFENVSFLGPRIIRLNLFFFFQCFVLLSPHFYCFQLLCGWVWFWFRYFYLSFAVAVQFYLVGSAVLWMVFKKNLIWFYTDQLFDSLGGWVFIANYNSLVNEFRVIGVPIVNVN